MRDFQERMSQFRDQAGMGVPIIGEDTKKTVMTVRFQSAMHYHKSFMNSYMALINYVGMHPPVPMRLIDEEASSALIEVSRAGAVMSALKHAADYLIMFDADQVYQQDTVIRLLFHAMHTPDIGIIGSNIWKRRDPVCICAYDYDPESGLYVSISDPHNPRGNRYVAALRNDESLVPVDAVGAGCMLINMAVCAKVPQPWFDKLPMPMGDWYGEDISFCRRAREAGVRAAVAMDVQIAHLVDDAMILPGGVLRAFGREWVDARYAAELQKQLTEVPDAGTDPSGDVRDGR